MKKVGIVILIIGIIITIFSGVKFVTKEKVVDIGNLEISADKTHAIDWSPYLGAALALVGGAIYLFGAKKS